MPTARFGSFNETALMNMLIRRSIPEEAELLSRIAHDAKKYWGYPENWIERWSADLTIAPDFVRDNPVYVAERDQQICGFYALSINGERAELEHMWVSPDYIGSGVGKELFLDAMDRSTAMNVRRIDITADPNAAGFYERMGATRTGDVVSEMDGQPRILPRMSIEPPNHE
jgi:ribosomal protein S18 acetylase RimI-like enzyme